MHVMGLGLGAVWDAAKRAPKKKGTTSSANSRCTGVVDHAVSYSTGSHKVEGKADVLKERRLIGSADGERTLQSTRATCLFCAEPGQITQLRPMELTTAMMQKAVILNLNCAVTDGGRFWSVLFTRVPNEA